jgi:hypothetical protein
MENVCSVTDCTGSHHAKGLCSIHYKRVLRHGSTNVATVVYTTVRDCSVEGCDRGGQIRRGYCDLHYWRWRKHGNPSSEVLRRQGTGINEEWFWSKITNSDPNGCWEWQGCRSRQGYGRLSVHENQKWGFAHRYSYFLVYGIDPGELCVLHRCDNPPCCNPAHLFLGTRVDNNFDRYIKGRSRRAAR